MFGVFALINPAHSAQDAVVMVDGAMVYQKESFDAAVIGYYRQGQKVRVSNKTYGPFYKVKFKQGVVGFISDVDVKILSVSKSESISKAKSSRSSQSRNYLAAKHIGLLFGYVNYSEILSTQKVNDGLLAYGIKATLPAPLIEGPFTLDLNLIYHKGAPKYYTPISTITPSGKIAFFETSLNFQVGKLMPRNGYLLIGAGPVITYSRFLVEVNGSKLDLEEIRIGAVGSIGVAIHMGALMFKIEPKFYFEKATYGGIYLGGLFSL